jgi:type III restriction enzyme
MVPSSSRNQSRLLTSNPVLRSCLTPSPRASRKALTLISKKLKQKKLDRTQDSFADYDLIGEIAEGTTLTRRTATAILTGINKDKLWLFRANPEEFISKVVGIINKQKASIVVEHITYAPSAEEPCTQDVFNMSRASDEHTKAFSAKRSIPDFVFAGIYQRLVQAGIAHS